MRVYRRQNKRYSNACVYECGRFGGGSVMVWDGINHCGRAELKLSMGTRMLFGILMKF